MTDTTGQFFSTLPIKMFLEKKGLTFASWWPAWRRIIGRPLRQETPPRASAPAASAASAASTTPSAAPAFRLGGLAALSSASVGIVKSESEFFYLKKNQANKIKSRERTQIPTFNGWRPSKVDYR